MLSRLFKPRPGNFSSRFEEVNGLFAVNYLFASQFVGNKVVLDIGCGTGYGAEFLVEKGVAQVTAIDKDKSIILNCRKFRRRRGRVTFCVSDATKLNFTEERFDVILSFEVIEHIEMRDHHNYLREILRVLKKGGFFLLSTPNKARWSPRLKTPIIVDHKKEFNKNELEHLLKRFFTQVKVFGKSPLNSEYIQAQRRFESSLRLKITRVLARSGVLRSAARFVPVGIRMVLSGARQVKTKADEWVITMDTPNPYSFLVVCRK